MKTRKNTVPDAFPQTMASFVTEETTPPTATSRSRREWHHADLTKKALAAGYTQERAHALVSLEIDRLNAVDALGDHCWSRSNKEGNHPHDHKKMDTYAGHGGALYAQWPGAESFDPFDPDPINALREARAWIMNPTRATRSADGRIELTYTTNYAGLAEMMSRAILNLEAERKRLTELRVTSFIGPRQSEAV